MQGERADFAVSEADPMEAAPEALKDVEIWGLVAAGLSPPASAERSAAEPPSPASSISYVLFSPAEFNERRK